MNSLGSLDRYECGDLSGKFGSLAGKDTYNLEKVDYNLNMFGYNSLMGRSIVLHEDKPGAPRFTCANLEPSNAKLITAKVNYTGDSALSGYVKMVRI